MDHELQLLLRDINNLLPIFISLICIILVPLAITSIKAIVGKNHNGIVSKVEDLSTKGLLSNKEEYDSINKKLDAIIEANLANQHLDPKSRDVLMKATAVKNDKVKEVKVEVEPTGKQRFGGKK